MHPVKPEKYQQRRNVQMEQNNVTNIQGLNLLKPYIAFLLERGVTLQQIGTQYRFSIAQPIDGMVTNTTYAGVEQAVDALVTVLGKQDIKNLAA